MINLKQEVEPVAQYTVVNTNSKHTRKNIHHKQYIWQ